MGDGDCGRGKLLDFCVDDLYHRSPRNILRPSMVRLRVIGMTVRSIVLLIGAVLKCANFTPIGNQVIGCRGADAQLRGCVRWHSEWAEVEV